jgi:hypothetical protein
MNQFVQDIISSLTQYQQAHSALPRSGRFDTPRTVNQRARPAPSRRTDLGVSDPMDWQPHTQSLGSDLNTQSRQERPDLSKLTNFNVPGPEGQGRPDLSKLTNFDTPGTEGQGRPDLSKLTNFNTPGTEGQGRPDLSKLTNFDTPGTEGQEPPAPSQSTAANVPNVVDSSAKNDEDKFDIDLEYR